MPVTPPVKRWLGTTNKFMELAAIVQPTAIPKYLKTFDFEIMAVSLNKIPPTGGYYNTLLKFVKYILFDEFFLLI